MLLNPLIYNDQSDDEDEYYQNVEQTKSKTVRQYLGDRPQLDLGQISPLVETSSR